MIPFESKEYHPERRPGEVYWLNHDPRNRDRSWTPWTTNKYKTVRIGRSAYDNTPEHNPIPYLRPFFLEIKEVIAIDGEDKFREMFPDTAAHYFEEEQGDD